MKLIKPASMRLWKNLTVSFIYLIRSEVSKLYHHTTAITNYWLSSLQIHICKNYAFIVYTCVVIRHGIKSLSSTDNQSPKSPYWYSSSSNNLLLRNDHYPTNPFIILSRLAGAICIAASHCIPCTIHNTLLHNVPVVHVKWNRYTSKIAAFASTALLCV